MEITNMSMNRRNVLVGLGTIVAGGGAALGTGAFSSVEANRDVTVETAGDGSAYLEMAGNDNYVSDVENDEVLELDLGGPESEAFNRDATTVVEGIVTLTNNAADGTDIEVGFGETGNLDGSTEVTVDDGEGNVAKVTFYFGDDTENANPQDVSDNSVELHAEIDTTVTESADESAEITIVAEEDTEE